jgi:hypothetical protein
MNQHTRPRKPPSETEEKIFAVIRSIPILKDGVTEEYCRAEANGLNGMAVMAHMNHQRPETQKIGARRTQAELEKLLDHANKIAKTLNAAHRETNALIEAALPKGKSLSQYKRDMAEVFRVLHQADDNSGELTAKGVKPSDEFAAMITQAAADAFTSLTGRKAAVIVKHVAGKSDVIAVSGGPFLDFLGALFVALNIDASADYHARQLRRNRA